MTFLLEVIVLVTLPFGTAILLGALAERLAGEIASSLASYGGLVLGIYFLHKSLEIITAS